MAKFNTRFAFVARRSPVVTGSAPAGLTHEGAPGFARDAKSELFLLAVAMMVSEGTFYEDAATRDARYEALVTRVAVEDPQWMARFVRWLRDGANMRSASLVAALQAAKAMVDHGVSGSRQIVDSALQRADEPGEALAWWSGRYGRAIPKPVKRGIADAVRRLYTPFALLRYDTATKGFRFGDVLELTHPAPVSPEQGDLFAWAITRRHDRSQEIPASLPMVVANAELRRAAAENPRVLLDVDALRAAGMTWEDALSLAGPTVNRAALWTALIPTMGYMALLRNLRGFDEAGVPDEVAATVAQRLADPEQVAKSRQFPFRFLAAYRATRSVRWASALEQALNASLSAVPRLPGRTLILVDLSGSMDVPVTGARSRMSRADAAKVFGAALALRAEKPTLVWFDTDSGAVRVPRGIALLKLIESFPRRGGGTNTAEAVRRWYDRHDRVVIVTDEQAHDNGDRDVTAGVPRHVPVYTWNLGGYRLGHAPSGLGTRHTFGGLTDAAFQAIPLLERRRDADWPF
ncbi:MAG: TROVE domain-containing protein [Micromonosporaceae bacterium]|nr:TROVE domain-containing protein [Micromonosporaceae bacterium]